jgi:YbbR domain-containing protein
VSALAQMARNGWLLLRAAVSSIAGNLGLAALALVLALALWLFVTDRENPTEARTFNSAIPLEIVNVPGDLAVANVTETSVRIRIEGSRSELDGLAAEDFTATVDLGGLSAGTHDVAVEVTPPNSRVNVVDATPSRVGVTLEPLRTREVPVEVVTLGSPVTGFEVTSVSVDPANVTVSGAESLVNLVEYAAAVVNLTGAQVNVTDQVELEPRDSRDGGISRVAVNPTSANVSVEIVQQEYSLQFAVTPNLTGEPASGFTIAALNVDPRIVTVVGPLDVLQTLESVGTEEIALTDARDDVIRTVTLTVPQGARIEGSGTARVTVDIEPLQGQSLFNVTPQVQGADPGAVVVPASDVAVTLTGSEQVLASISPASITVTIDVSGLGEGLHAVPVEVTPPPGTTVTRVEPGELGVAITLP